MRNKINFVGGEYSNKFPQNENKMRTMVGPGSDMSFVGGEYSNKFPQNKNKMRTMVGPGSDMSFSGSFNKFPSTNSSNGEQSGFSRVNVDNQSAGILNESKSYFSSSNDDSFNPRNNHSNAAGVSRPMPTPSYRGGMISPVVGGAPNPVVSKKSRRKSEDRISVNPVGGVARKRRPKAVTPVAVAAKQIGGGRECTPPSVWCKSGDYLGCHAEHKCNGGLRQEKRKTRKSNFAAATRVFPEGQRNTESKMNASGCGYSNFHHKSGFSGESRRKNIFK